MVTQAEIEEYLLEYVEQEDDKLPSQRLNRFLKLPFPFSYRVVFMLDNVEALAKFLLEKIGDDDQ